MKIRELIETLLKVHTLEDEIIVDWISKESLYDWPDSGDYEHNQEEFNKAWLAIQEKGLDEMTDAISHYGVIYEVRNLVLDKIQEMRNENV